MLYQLKNGAACLLQKPTRDNCKVVLAKTATDYVTWIMDSSGVCFWGDYFGYDYKAAIQNFRERV